MISPERCGPGGLKFGVSNHSMEHFSFVPIAANSAQTHPQWAPFYSTADRSPEAREKFLELWVNKNLELIDRYQPDMLWFDNGVNGRNLDPQNLKVAAFYYNRAGAPRPRPPLRAAMHSSPEPSIVPSPPIVNPSRFVALIRPHMNGRSIPSNRVSTIG